MLRQMSSQDWLNWLAYAHAEPFGAWWDGKLNANLAQVMWQLRMMDVPKKDRPEMPRLEQFELNFVDERPFRTQTWQQQKAVAKMTVDAWNAQFEIGPDGQPTGKKKRRGSGT